MPEMWINMGPQHPSTHGLWDLLVRVDGETVTASDPKFGYIYRSIEKLAEIKTYAMFAPIPDRLCYVANASWSCLYAMTVETLMGIEAPPRAQYIRTIVLELQRIASHFVWLAAYCADLGVLSMFLFPLRERELVLDLMTLATGTRMMYHYPRIGGVKCDFPPQFIERTVKAAKYILKRLDEYEEMLDDSEVFRMRNIDVGVLPKRLAIDLGMTGPMLRGSGVAKDLRRDDPYLVYDRFDFDIPVGERGDCWDRYRVRLEEVRQSCRIVLQAVREIPEGPVMAKVPREVPAGSAFVHIEDPRGEGAMYIESDGGKTPYRLHIKSPTYIHLMALPWYLKNRRSDGKLVGCKVADVPVIMGTGDPCIGEVDR